MPYYSKFFGSFDSASPKKDTLHLQEREGLSAVDEAAGWPLDIPSGSPHLPSHLKIESTVCHCGYKPFVA